MLKILMIIYYITSITKPNLAFVEVRNDAIFYSRKACINYKTYFVTINKFT